MRGSSSNVNTSLPLGIASSTQLGGGQVRYIKEDLTIKQSRKANGDNSWLIPGHAPA